MTYWGQGHISFPPGWMFANPVRVRPLGSDEDDSLGWHALFEVYIHPVTGLGISMVFGSLDLQSIRYSHLTNSKADYPEQLACLQQVLRPGMMSHPYFHTKIGQRNMAIADCRCKTGLVGLLHAFHMSVDA